MRMLVLSSVLILMAEGSASYQDRQGREDRWTKKRLVESSSDTWGRAVDMNRTERLEIVRGLGQIGLERERDPEERILAILELGKMPCKETFAFLLENITLKIDRRYYLSDTAREEECACQFTLASIGWAAMPEILEHLKRERSESELVAIGGVLKRACGKEAALGVLASQQGRGSDVFLKNVGSLIEALKR